MNSTAKTTCIFPSLGLSGSMLRRVTRLFPTVVVCLPWYMDIPFREGEGPDQGFPEVLRPARDLMPPKNFPQLIKEYKTWMKDNLGRGRSASLAAVRDIHPNGEASWKIREMVRNEARGKDLDDKDSLSMKWHLLLHLAQAMEEEQSQAQDALHRLRKKDHPLREALGEDFVGSDIMKDLPDGPVPPVSESDVLKDICESWLGLFGTFIRGVRLLVTFDENIKQYVKELFVEAASKVDLIRQVPTIRFLLPDPLTSSSRGTGIASVHDFQESAMRIIDKIHNVVSNRGSEESDALDALIGDIEDRFPARDSTPPVAVELLSLPLISGPHSSKAETILNGLGGKVLAFVEEVSNNA